MSFLSSLRVLNRKIEQSAIQFEGKLGGETLPTIAITRAFSLASLV
jgi:hypothetical protein